MYIDIDIHKHPPPHTHIYKNIYNDTNLVVGLT